MKAINAFLLLTSISSSAFPYLFLVRLHLLTMGIYFSTDKFWSSFAFSSEHWPDVCPVKAVLDQVAIAAAKRRIIPTTKSNANLYSENRRIPERILRNQTRKSSKE